MNPRTPNYIPASASWPALFNFLNAANASHGSWVRPSAFKKTFPSSPAAVSYREPQTVEVLTELHDALALHPQDMFQSHGSTRACRLHRSLGRMRHSPSSRFFLRSGAQNCLSAA